MRNNLNGSEKMKKIIMLDNKTKLEFFLSETKTKKKEKEKVLLVRRLKIENQKNP